MQLLLIIILFIFSALNVSANTINSGNSNFRIEEDDNYGLVLVDEKEEILIQEYSSEDDIEAVSYGDYVIYNGAAGIGLYLYSPADNQSYTLNSPGDYRSAVFYYQFKVVEDKLFINSGIEAASMPKICVYDLQKMNEELKNVDNIIDMLQATEDSPYLSLREFTEKNSISYCTIGDGKYYYETEFSDNQKLNYIVCEDSLCKQDNYIGGEVYESDWNGENKKLIKIIGDIQSEDQSEIRSWFKTPILYISGAIVLLIGFLALRKHK